MTKNKKLLYIIANKKVIGIILGVVSVMIIALVIWGVRQPKRMPFSPGSSNGDVQADIIYYFGQGCSHCDNVEKFLADKKISEKVLFASKEVWQNRNNESEMESRAQECGLDPTKVGVPFVFSREKCYVGETEVENFFKKEAGVQ